MKVALVHEHLAQDGGAERVVQVLMRMFPSAPLYTLVYNAQRANPFFRGKDIRTSFLQKMPGGARYYQWYLTLMPTAIEQLDLRDFDVVISSASAFAKGIITDPTTLHICYLHAHTRYLWNDSHRYVSELHYPAFIRKIIPIFLTRLRMWDRLAADRVDAFIANSRYIQHSIKKYYHRDSTVIYPPVDISRFNIGQKVGNYYLTGGRLVPYKRFDVAVQAFNRLGLPLKVFGTGPAMSELQAMAKSNIEFLGRVEDDQMTGLYNQAIAFINPQVEDFGITAIEAMASGRPVIAFDAGGARETVRAGETGIFFREQEWEALADAVIRFKPEQYRSADIRAWAVNFSVEHFAQNMQQFLAEAWQKHQAGLPW